MTNHALTSPQVSIVNGQAVTTSKAIAEFFHKRHDNVITRIRNLIAEIEDREYRLLNFKETVETRTNPSGGASIESPAYNITREGFSLLAMGFTGKLALQWKIQYINTFNAMEASLKPQTLAPNLLDQQLHYFQPLYSLSGQQLDMLVAMQMTQQIGAETAICAAVAACAQGRELDEATITLTLHKVANGLFAINEPVGAAFFDATARLLETHQQRHAWLQENINQPTPKIKLTVLRTLD